MFASVTAVEVSTSITYVSARCTVWRAPHFGHTTLNERGKSGFSLEYRPPTRAKKMRSRQRRFGQSVAKNTSVIGLLAAGAFWGNEAVTDPGESQIARGTTTTPWPALTVRTTFDAQSGQKPEIFVLAVFDFQSKQFSFAEIAQTRRAGRVRTLGDHRRPPAKSQVSERRSARYTYIVSRTVLAVNSRADKNSVPKRKTNMGRLTIWRVCREV
jgi:hypothetical protein